MAHGFAYILILLNRNSSFLLNHKRLSLFARGEAGSLKSGRGQGGAAP